jgi:DNA-directed RNA polymerase specialized sigma24 family protein
VSQLQEVSDLIVVFTPETQENVLSRYSDGNVASGYTKTTGQVTQVLKGQAPEQLVIEQEVSRELWNRVNSRLSPMEKQVLQFYLDGNNYMQIAGLMKKSPKSVDNALQRIRQKIRQMNHLEERG